MNASDLGPEHAGRVLVIPSVAVAPDGTQVVDEVHHRIGAVSPGEPVIVLTVEGAEFSFSPGDVVELVEVDA